jgi:membrane associated rhomboid family serine protease
MLFPIGDDNYDRETTPYVVYVLIAINVLVFILQLSGGDEFTAAYAAIPYEITTGEDLTRAVQLRGVGVIPQAPGPTPIYLTILTSMFMHGGFMHIIGNMLYLWIFGDNIEDNFGHVKFLAFYLICGVVASLSQIFVDPTSVIPTVGASGAIAGVLGAYLIMFPRNRVRSILPLGFIWTTVELPAIAVLGFWIVIQVFSQYTAFTNTRMAQGGGVAYMAHIGGFVAGVLLVFLFRRSRPRPTPRYYDYE